MCMVTYQEGTSSEEESDPEDPAGPRARQGEGNEELRPYCSCGKALRRVAKVPDYAALLHCTSPYECVRCEEEILAGELHFRCNKCDNVKVCKDCGPGVYIERNYDYFDRSTGEKDVQEIPSRVIHTRRARQDRLKSRRGRGVVLSDGGEDGARALQLAEQAVRVTEQLVDDVMEQGADEYDAEWGDDSILLRLLCARDADQAFENVMVLVSAAQRVLAHGPTVTDVQAPCKVFGDVHGQLRDLLLLFGSFGFPGSAESPNVVFNGDFVDRGKHQVEVLVVLLALKILYPDNIFLNRGNHEDSKMNSKYGFEGACKARFSNGLADHRGSHLFKAISSCFHHLPMASVIQDKILVVHGGIGDGQWTLPELRRVRRPLQHSDLEEQQWLWNLLWSDPIEDDEVDNKVFGVHPSPRGKRAVKFGWNVTQAFCAKNGLDLVVRSHQAKKGGLGFDVMHNESLIRVFSARDYERNGNDCAVLSVTDSEEADGETGGVLNVRPQVLSALSRD